MSRSRGINQTDQYVSSTNGQMVRTSFLAWKVEVLLQTPQISYIQCSEITVSVHGNNQTIYCLNAANAQGNIPPPLVGDLPCPEHCMPPTNGLINGNSYLPATHTFDTADFQNIINHILSQNWQWPLIPLVDVALMKDNNNNFSLAIYPSDGFNKYNRLQNICRISII